MVEYMFSEVLLIDLDGELTNIVIRKILAAEVIVFILQFKDEHHIFPCVLEPDMIGDISEYHFNSVIETVVEGRIVFVMKGLFMHTIHFGVFKTPCSITFCNQEEAAVFSALDYE
jgi:hypothetical protein